MTRKTYVALAEALKKSRPSQADAKAEDTWKATVENVAVALKSLSSGFNRDKFLEACYK